MDSGDTFTPDGLTKDTDLIEDFYGSKGYIEISEGQALQINRVPNVDTGTMDLEFILGDSEKSHVQKIEIRGNLKTKDKVIRRELAISPGDVLDMVRVKISKQRLEGLGYFDKVDARPEPIDPPTPGQKDLIINVEEKNTGNFTVGAGFSSVDSLVGYAEVSQSNFDLFHPPYFTGGGEKIRLRVDEGLVYQNYELSFVEPWFLNRKLSLGVDLYYTDLNFESPNNIYDETRAGAKVSLTRALGSDFLIGSVSATAEDVGISLNSGWHNAPYANDRHHRRTQDPQRAECHPGAAWRSFLWAAGRLAGLRHPQQRAIAQSWPAHRNFRRIFRGRPDVLQAGTDVLLVFPWLPERTRH